ncbi:MAG: CPBP family intramembrane metalloprotease [Kyrpidia tusciae]|nr:CPBP family intramembrane glutamic endopeptidase [Kyrpidia tusciae]MBE3552559.1 CPBP family intramembrane metalloprotease [Kyrpidia tusciae]
MRSSSDVLRQLWLLKGIEACLGLFLVWIIDVHHGVPWGAALGIRDPVQVFGLGTALAVAMIAVESVLVRFFPEQWVVDKRWLHPLDDLPRFHLFVLMGITAMAEELLFRAGIQRIAVDLFGLPALGISATAVLFAFLHFYSHKAILPRLTILGIALAFGWTYWWTANIAVVAWCHFLFNSLPFVFKKQKTVNL